ncbi:hypothetical protein LguiB_019622 [Lonicera macranthoides]
MTAIMHDKELAIAELEAAKALFHQNLQESVEDKFYLKSKLVLAKQDAVELAVQVEKLAEVAFQWATAHILEDACLRISVAETSAAEAAYQIEEQIWNATKGIVISIVQQSKRCHRESFACCRNSWCRILSYRTLDDLKSKLSITRNESDRLKLELEKSRGQANAFQLQANDAEEAMLEFQESSKKKNLQQEEEVKSLIDGETEEDSAEKRKTASKAFKVELEAIKAAIEAAKQTAHSKDEATSGNGDEEAIYVVNGGWIDLLTKDDSDKWKLLSDGPCREILDWMARRICTIRPKFPPIKVDASEALMSRFKSLDLPNPKEVWSISQEKPKEGDTLIEHMIKKEIIEKKRKLFRTARNHTGHEIVFQGFKFSIAKAGEGSGTLSWLLKLLIYLAAGLQQCVIFGQTSTTWTRSAYGTEEEQKHCIEEMHNQDLLSPNGVWNIFGGKLGWGPEAIVCDDPNFQGRGNPSSGKEFSRCVNVITWYMNLESESSFMQHQTLIIPRILLERDIKEWLNWLRNEIGFDGWRLDFVREANLVLMVGAPILREAKLAASFS